MGRATPNTVKGSCLQIYFNFFFCCSYTCTYFYCRLFLQNGYFNPGSSFGIFEKHSFLFYFLLWYNVPSLNNLLCSEHCLTSSLVQPINRQITDSWISTSAYTGTDPITPLWVPVSQYVRSLTFIVNYQISSVIYAPNTKSVKISSILSRLHGQQQTVYR